MAAANKVIMHTCLVVCVCIGGCVFCTVNAYVHVHMCLCVCVRCWHQSHGWHVSADVSSVPVDSNNSGITAGRRNLWNQDKAKRPLGHYLYPETFHASWKSICICKYFSYMASHTHTLQEVYVTVILYWWWHSEQRKPQGHLRGFTPAVRNLSLLERKRGQREDTIGVAWTINL